MNYHYCQACFKKTPQTVDIIKFCAHCGKPFLENINQSTLSHGNLTRDLTRKSLRDKLRQQLKSNHKQSIIDDDQDNDTDDLLDDNDIESDDNIRVPNIHKLDLEVDVQQDKGVAISHIAQAAKRQPKPENTSNKKTKFNKKQFLAQYQKEASSIRQK